MCSPDSNPEPPADYWHTDPATLQRQADFHQRWMADVEGRKREREFARAMAIAGDDGDEIRRIWGCWKRGLPLESPKAPDLSSIAAQIAALAAKVVPVGEATTSDSDNRIASDDGAPISTKGRRMRLKVNGPYRHYSKWRIFVTRLGVKKHEDFPTEEEAQAAADRVRREMRTQNGITVAQALAEYEANLVTRGRKAAGILTVVGNVRVFFKEHLETPVTALTLPEIERAVRRIEAQKYSPATLAAIAGMSRTFMRFCARRRFVKQPHLEPLTGVGSRRRGSKPQLRQSEAQTWLATAMKQVTDGDTGALAAAMLLLTGLRAGELTERLGRDVDSDGRVLWVSDGKNEASNRPVKIPALLADCLWQRAKAVGPAGRLFAGGKLDCKKSRIDAVSRKVQQICKLSGLHRVTSHGLRGSFASLALLVNVAPDQIAAALAHSSFDGMTRRHYADPAALATAEQERVLVAVTGHRSAVTAESVSSVSERSYSRSHT
jgi:integrase